MAATCRAIARSLSDAIARYVAVAYRALSARAMCADTRGCNGGVRQELAAQGGDHPDGPAGGGVSDSATRPRRRGDRVKRSSH
jgi:hypothetical protein